MNIMHFDLIIVGKGRAGIEIGQAALSLGKKVALIKLPEASESHLINQISALFQDGHPDPLPPPPPELEVIEGPCRFRSKKEIETNAGILTSHKFVLNTGFVPYVPSIPGLGESPYKTPQKILGTHPLPKKVAIMGAGPVGVSLSQILKKGGTQVDLYCRSKGILPGEEPEISILIQNQLISQGINIFLNTSIQKIKTEAENRIEIQFEEKGQANHRATESLVLATGVIPNTQGLNLENAGVYIGPQGGIAVNEELRTSQPGIWAAGNGGDPPYQFSQEFQHAQILKENLWAPFFSRLKLEEEHLPYLIPGDFPLAHIGLGEKEAREKYKDVRIVYQEGNGTDSLKGNNGGIKLVGRKKSGSLLGVHWAGLEAPHIIHFFHLVIRAGIPLKDLSENEYFGFRPADPIEKVIQSWAQQ